jgi:hypothetical protein
VTRKQQVSLSNRLHLKLCDRLKTTAYVNVTNLRIDVGTRKKSLFKPSLILDVARMQLLVIPAAFFLQFGSELDNWSVI